MTDGIFSMDTLLLIAIFLPLAAAGLVLCVPAGRGGVARGIAVAATALGLALGLVLFAQFPRAAAGYQFGSCLAWLPTFGISLRFGLDGISLGLFLLTGLVGLAGALLSRPAPKDAKTFFALYLVLVGGALGAFATLNLLVFYLFAEFEVLASYLLIAGWGRVPSLAEASGRESAAMQLTLFVAAGSLLFALGLLALYALGGAQTFDLPALQAHLAAHPLAPGAQRALFLLLLAGFGILIGICPLHIWAPAGYAAAPTAVSMFSAGVLKQLGIYGLLRIALPLLPAGAQQATGLLATLAIVNILYAGWVALRQTDWKWLIAYTSISHVGYVLLGLAARNVIGLGGVVLMMVAHGLSTALLFALVGHLEQQTGGRRAIAVVGGLARQAPFIGVALVMAALASAGVPGFANFVSELLVLVGAWMHGTALLRLAVVAGVWGLVLTATYLLRAVRTTCFGPVRPDQPPVADAAGWAARLPVLLLLLALLLLGVAPRLLTDPATAALQAVAAAPANPASGPR